MLHKLAGLILSALLLAGCNLQNADATSTPPPESAATHAPIISVLPVTEGNQAASVCYFKPYGIGAPFEVYSDPETAQVQHPAVIAQIDTGMYYPVVSEVDVWIQLVVAEGVTGWVRTGIGGLVGNCNSIPRSSVRPIPPEGICTVYYDKIMQDDAIFTDQTGTTMLEPLTPGQYFTVEARGQSRGFKIKLPDGRTGWIMTPDQVLSMNNALNGPCDTLPVEVSTVPGG